jgi:hypothetical protein
VLHQSALREDLRRLRACGIELRLCLRDVESRGDARAMALLGKSKRVVEGRHCIVEDRILAVEASQLHVIVHELGEQGQAGVLQVCGRGLRIGFARGYLVADLSPKVELVAHAAAEDVVIVIARRGWRDQRRVFGLAVALH